MSLEALKEMEAGGQLEMNSIYEVKNVDGINPYPFGVFIENSPIGWFKTEEEAFFTARIMNYRLLIKEEKSSSNRAVLDHVCSLIESLY